MEIYTYAIIGGGIAGVSCVEQILEYDPEARILLISTSPVVKEAANVTRLTKTLQDFILVEKSLRSFKDVHQTVNVLQDHVDKFIPDEHRIITKSGIEFGYKKLCICTGGRPNILFQNREHLLGIRDTESVRELASRVSKSRRIILLGNGGIATEFVHEVDGIEIYWAVKDKSISAHFVDPGAAEFFIQAKLNKETEEKNKNQVQNVPLVSKRMKYTLSDPVDNVTSTETNEPGSALGPDWHRDVNLKGLCEKKNVKILYKTECTSISYHSELSPEDLKSLKESEQWNIYARLSTGELIGADVIISATGILPNCEWASDCKQLAEKGIFVDTAMRTSIQDVFAAGDVCFPNWTWAKHWFQMRLWTQARHMGLYAGKSMYLSYQNDLKKLDSREEESSAEKQEEIELDFCFEIFSHVTRFFGFKVILLGLFNGQGVDPSKQHLLVRCTKNLEYIKLVLEDWRLQGAILIGETGLEETFENLILNQVDLSPFGEDLLNPDIDIEDFFD